MLAIERDIKLAKLSSVIITGQQMDFYSSTWPAVNLSQTIGLEESLEGFTVIWKQWLQTCSE